MALAARGASREAAGPFRIAAPLRQPGLRAGRALALRSARMDVLGTQLPTPGTFPVQVASSSSVVGLEGSLEPELRQ